MAAHSLTHPAPGDTCELPRERIWRGWNSAGP
jgi:hypothetical protein